MRASTADAAVSQSSGRFQRAGLRRAGRLPAVSESMAVMDSPWPVAAAESSVRGPYRRPDEGALLLLW
ncbi:hypothetical protein Axi01nite_00870 [Actinoplanes xinjiangensis]|nr:hypothetical protein Axi01nite_00870 [Actinoplanes xinjiangensis]